MRTPLLPLEQLLSPTLPEPVPATALQPLSTDSPFHLLLQSINNIRTIRHEPIQIGIVPHHLLRIPRAHRRRAVLHIHDIVALEIGVDERAPHALVAVHAAEEERRDARLLEVEAEWSLRAPETGEAVCDEDTSAFTPNTR